MPCFYPLDAWQDLGNQVHFHKKGPGGQRTLGPFPNFKRNIKLPCGRCTGCRLERSRQWAVRCLHESQQHTNNCFLTLTLQDAEPDKEKEKHRELSTIARSANKSARAHGDNSLWGSPEGLSLRTHQLFMKRLRKHTKQKSLRYYMCGEYGDLLGRPHYHYIIFGYDFPDKYVWRTSEGKTSYRSPSLEKIWGLGHCEIAEVNFETCAYVARYVMKKITGNLAHEHYRRERDDGTEYWLTPEFNQMSRNPGIASTWWHDFHTDVYPQDAIIHKGKKAKPPRYYDKLLEKLKPFELDQIKKRRELEQANNKQDNTPQRLKAKEACTLAALKLKTRNLE